MIGDRPAHHSAGEGIEDDGQVGLQFPVGCSVTSITQRRSGSAGSKDRWTRSSEGSGPEVTMGAPARRRRWMPATPAGASALDAFTRAADVVAEFELGVDPGRAIGALAHGPDVDDGVAQVGVLEVFRAHRVDPPGIRSPRSTPSSPNSRPTRASPCRPGR